MAQFSSSPKYSKRFMEALSAAAELHKFQERKQGGVPYLSHLLGVTAIVFKAGGTEDEAIAALLHDSIEDVETERLWIGNRFGSQVLEIVEALSEDKNLPKAQRKTAYVESIRKGSRSVQLVSCADKLDNLRDYLTVPELVTPDVIDFYGKLVPIYQWGLGDIPMVREITALNETLKARFTANV